MRAFGTIGAFWGGEGLGDFVILEILGIWHHQRFFWVCCTSQF
jgi:hypothetical protein